MEVDSESVAMVLEPGESGSAVRPAQVPIFEVAFRNGYWWDLPAHLSQAIYEKYQNGEDVSYTWDWGNQRYGSFEIDGKKTSVNRYLINFTTWEQRNMDNDRRRSVRLKWVDADKVDAKWTGQIPGSVEQTAASSGAVAERGGTAGQWLGHSRA